VTTTIAPKTATPPAAPDPVGKASKELEAFFLKRLMSEARGSGGGMLDGGFAGDTFREMLDGALSDQMSKSGGVGLAKVIQKSLHQDPETPSAIGALGVLQPSAHPPVPLAHPGRYAPTAIDGLSTTAPSAELASGAAFLKPAPGRYTSGFGERIDPINHDASVHPGLDIAARTGTPVVAAAAGKVVRAGDAGTYGNLVVIRHPSGLETRYAHLSAVTVKAGDEVGPGQEVGLVGATGRVTGPHLHFEVRKDGKALDPRPYLEGAEDSSSPPSTRSTPGR
jgi:murein DD-endopeptidase MepM/ murein hydrolase activator NlpD